MVSLLLIILESKCVTKSVLVHTLDMEKCSVQDTQFSADFALTPLRDGELTAIAGYFDTFFDMKEKPVWFTTGEGFIT